MKSTLEINMKDVVWIDKADVPAQELFPGIRKQTLWIGENGAKSLIVEFDAGSCWQGIDVHEPGAEEVYVVSGVFNDGVRDYPAGSFIHNPAFTSHVPQSESGCTLFLFYPEG